MSSLSLIGMLAGGVGIFLLAVGMLTDGLKLAAGQGLRNILGSWTRSPVHGIFTGFFITAVVQSSSAITVATIGFVNAGLLSMSQALGVVYGANIGTTLTGWIVAAVGFDLNISALALPIIGLGMLLKITGGQSRRAAIGTALVGFGLFFIGVQVLKDAFEGIVATFDMERFTMEGVSGLLLYLGIGFLMTVLTQSSSAAIAITLTAASGGVLGIYAAGAMVIGANLGTTSTAVVSVIGATANAKRVAAAHVLFNGITGLVALLLLPLMFRAVNVITGLLDVESEPAISLALFHTVFNCLGVVLMLPFTAKLAAFLNVRFTTQEELLGKPKYLDKNTSVTPDLALNAAVLELIHLSELSRELCGEALHDGGQRAKSVTGLHNGVVNLVEEIGNFVMQLQRGNLPREVAESLPDILRCSQYFLTATELAMEINANPLRGKLEQEHKIHAALSAFHAEVSELLMIMDVGAADFSSLAFEQRTAQMKEHYDTHKENNLKHSVESGLAIELVSELIEHGSNIRRMATQMSKGTLLLSRLQVKVNNEAEVRQQQVELHEELVSE